MGAQDLLNVVHLDRGEHLTTKNRWGCLSDSAPLLFKISIDALIGVFNSCSDYLIECSLILSDVILSMRESAFIQETLEAKYIYYRSASYPLILRSLIPPLLLLVLPRLLEDEIRGEGKKMWQ